jgi:hypothetical protein
VVGGRCDILAPLPHISTHVVDRQFIRRLGSYRIIAIIDTIVVILTRQSNGYYYWH